MVCATYSSRVSPTTLEYIKSRKSYSVRPGSEKVGSSEWLNPILLNPPWTSFAALLTLTRFRFWSEEILTCEMLSRRNGELHTLKALTLLMQSCRRPTNPILALTRRTLRPSVTPVEVGPAEQNLIARRRLRRGRNCYTTHQLVTNRGTGTANWSLASWGCAWARL